MRPHPCFLWVYHHHLRAVLLLGQGTCSSSWVIVQGWPRSPSRVTGVGVLREDDDPGLSILGEWFNKLSHKIYILSVQCAAPALNSAPFPQDAWLWSMWPRFLFWDSLEGWGVRAGPSQSLILGLLGRLCRFMIKDVWTTARGCWWFRNALRHGCHSKVCVLKWWEAGALGWERWN